MPNEYYLRTKSSGNFATDKLVHNGIARFVGGTFNSNCSAASHIIVYDSDGVSPRNNSTMVGGFYFPPGGGCNIMALPDIEWAIDILNGIYVEFDGTGTNAIVWYGEPAARLW